MALRRNPECPTHLPTETALAAQVDLVEGLVAPVGVGLVATEEAETAKGVTEEVVLAAAQVGQKAAVAAVGMATARMVAVAAAVTARGAKAEVAVVVMARAVRAGAATADSWEDRKVEGGTREEPAGEDPAADWMEVEAGQETEVDSAVD